jgi:hypothetical protein
MLSVQDNDGVLRQIPPTAVLSRNATEPVVFHGWIVASGGILVALAEKIG